MRFQRKPKLAGALQRNILVSQKRKEKSKAEKEVRKLFGISGLVMLASSGLLTFTEISS